MNIITYNVRGLRRGIKWSSIRRMVKKEHIDMICIQETKKEVIEKSMCQALWGDSEISWEAHPASNSACRFLCMLQGVHKGLHWANHEIDFLESDESRNVDRKYYVLGLPKAQCL